MIYKDREWLVAGSGTTEAIQLLGKLISLVRVVLDKFLGKPNAKWIMSQMLKTRWKKKNIPLAELEVASKMIITNSLTQGYYTFVSHKEIQRKSVQESSFFLKSCSWWKTFLLEVTSLSKNAFWRLNYHFWCQGNEKKRT